jgi:hypothetical protein
MIGGGGGVGFGAGLGIGGFIFANSFDSVEYCPVLAGIIGHLIGGNGLIGGKSNFNGGNLKGKFKIGTGFISIGFGGGGGGGGIYGLGLTMIGL